MKKQIFAIAAIVIVGSTALYSCKKENVTPETSAQASSVKKKGFTNMEHYGDKINGEDVPHKPCKETPVNCVILPDIIITGYDRLESVVLEGPIGIANYMRSSESEALRRYLGEDISAMLQSGEYAMVLDYKDARTRKFYVGKGQVSAGNFEFAMQIPVK